MEQYSGKAIFKGVAIGKAAFFGKKEETVKRYKVEDTAAEIARFEAAKAQAIEDLGKLHDTAIKKVGEEHAAIFEVHAMLLDDEDFSDSVHNSIETQQVNAEYATAIAGDNFSRMFAEMEDDYFRARAADMKDIAERVISLLSGGGDHQEWNEPVIIIADDLLPSQTVQLDKDKVLAFVTKKGSSNSHTAILARTMNIPALIGVPVSEAWDGKEMIVDAGEGVVILDPDEDTLKEKREIQGKELEAKRLLLELKGKENISLDGKEIKLYANIGSLGDVGAVLSNDGGGIGLFRSEFIYIGRDELPTEEEQFQIYRSVAETMAGKKVIIRTLDIGADKQADYLNLEKEENPALGFRAIRICLSDESILVTQLRAIYRASVYGNISIMYPMITSVDEVRRIKEISAHVRSELIHVSVPIGEVEEGIMIETPAAAVISDLLAKEVDFFSIGTNDLTQYTLAMDRQNAKLEAFYNPHHEAILRLIETVVKNGHAEGCWVGICGELGADTELTETFLKYGVDELSVSPSMVLPVRKQIRSSHAFEA